MIFRNPSRFSVFIIFLSVCLNLAGFAIALGFLTSEAAIDHRRIDESYAETMPARPPIRYVTTTIKLAAGVSRWPKALAVDNNLGVTYVAEGERGTVTLIAGTSIINSFPLGRHIEALAIDSLQDVAYASAQNPFDPSLGRVAIIRNGQIQAHLLVGGDPGPVVVDSVRQRAYVAVQTVSPFSDQLAIFQQASRLPPISTPPLIVGLAIDELRDRTYVISEAGPSLSIIEGLSNGAVVPLESIGRPRAIAVEPTSGLVYVSGQSVFRETGVVAVISGTQQIAQVSVGADPDHLAVNLLTQWIYVSNAGDDTVMIIRDTDVIETIDVGSRPGSIQVDSEQDLVYVSNQGSDTTSLIAENTNVATLPAGGGPLAIDQEAGVAYLGGNGVAAVHRETLVGRLS